MHLRRARYLAAAGRSATAETEYERALAAPGLHAAGEGHAPPPTWPSCCCTWAGTRTPASGPGRRWSWPSSADGSTADLVRASAALGFSDAFREDPDAGLAVIRHAVEIAERSGHPDDIGCAYLHLAELLTGPLNSLEEGVLVARRGAREAGRAGRRAARTRRGCWPSPANGLFRVGPVGRGRDGAGRPRCGTGRPAPTRWSCCWPGAGCGSASATSRRPNRDLDAVATVLAGGGARHVLPMLTLRAGLAMWQGRHAEARAAVQRGLTETRSDDLVLLGVLAWHGLRAEAEAHASGTVPVDPDAVRRLKVVVDRMARGVGNAARRCGRWSTAIWICARPS